ncbi:MAG: hypothetical protein ABSE63_02060, partial [Thermoguttaceae bacterium]
GDDLTKWLGIKYSSWPNELRESNNELLESYQKEVQGIAVLFANYRLTARRQALTERQFDSLRTIEAIRLYAYSHGGKLPGSLDDVKEVPIPPNPMTGKPFSYRLEGDTAVMLADGDTQTNYEYRIKIAK